MPAKRAIDWSSADVLDGTLTVKLDGKASKKWVERMEAVLHQLGGSDDVAVSGRKIAVEGLTPGGEEELRHLLESAIHQVNADLGLHEDEDEDSGDDRSEPDREMTDAFRAFAG